MSDTLTIRHCRTAQANATLNEALDSALAWLDDNQSAEKEECDSRRKELEMVAAPLLENVLSKASVDRGEDHVNGPTVEEVD